ncbi:MAG: hypothetical protein P9M15_02740 [Candidatus Electryoneaceae bacterium]|nr:hypothetical protein [Candidatus Electryoneaceae bacterium]
MQDLRYGRIEHLTIREGDPTFNSSMRVIRQVLLGKRSQGKQDPPSSDFELKSQMIDMFRYFDRLQDGVIPLLIVQDGLPFQLQLEEQIL